MARVPLTTVRCLFVGAGAIANEYAAGLAGSPLSLAGVCDLDGQRAAALAEEYGCPSFSEFERALARVDASLVVNLTSHTAHAAITRKALAAGCHVYSQKPLALDAGAAADLLASARDRNLALGCAPENPQAPSQRRVGRLLADGRLGSVQLGYAHAHVGRVTDWHDRPDAFLDIGPLYDGGVYPLTLLVSLFGPVETVRYTETLDVWPGREDKRPSAPSHIETMLDFDTGPTVRLTASFYAPHRSREFYGLELHGDDGSLYLDSTGAMSDSVDAVRFGRVGREYTTVPPQSPSESRSYIDAVEALADSVRAGTPSRTSARRGAHVVAVCNAIEAAAETGRSMAVDDYGATSDGVPAPVAALGERDRSERGRESLRLPPIGFGCSRYRGGEYVDRTDSIAKALDAGYRLFDSAELYGNEHRIGDLLSAAGAPDREHLFILGKVWRTNHQREHLLEACAGSLDELGIDAFDCYALHWPDAWAHRGEVSRLAERPVDRQEAVTFPQDENGEPETGDVSLAQTWRNLETVSDRGWAHSLGICNVSRAQLEEVFEVGSIDPALVQIERHPYRPQDDLVSFCHEQGVRVVAHSPLSAPGLLEEPVVRDISEERTLSPAGVVLAWNVTQGVVPIPSSTTPEHVVDNLAAASRRLTDDDCARLDGLRRPEFER